LISGEKSSASQVSKELAFCHDAAYFRDFNCKGKEFFMQLGCKSLFWSLWSLFFALFLQNKQMIDREV
jgi:hypothetical protein